MKKPDSHEKVMDKLMFSNTPTLADTTPIFLRRIRHWFIMKCLMKIFRTSDTQKHKREIFVWQKSMGNF